MESPECLSLSGIWGYGHRSNVIHLPASRASSTPAPSGIFPRASLCLSYWKNSSCWHFWASQGARGAYLYSAHFCITAAPTYLLISWVQVAISRECTIRSTWQFQSPSESGRRFFWWASTCPTLTDPLNSQSEFYRAMPHTGIPLIVQFSITHIP